jgi:predicted secreted protein
MTTNADIGYGADLLKETATPGQYATFGVELTNIVPPSFTRDAVEATHLKSAGGYREFVPGLMSIGEIQMEGNYVPSDADAVFAAISEDTGNWRVMFNNNTTLTVAGFFTAFEPQGLTPEGKMMFSATLKGTGEPVWA